MSITIFRTRLQTIEESGKYSEKAIRQFGSILKIHKETLPRVFLLKNMGMHTISGILKELGYVSFSITAPLGAKFSIRKVVLPSKSVTKKPAG